MRKTNIGELLATIALVLVLALVVLLVVLLVGAIISFNNAEPERRMTLQLLEPPHYRWTRHREGASQISFTFNLEVGFENRDGTSSSASMKGSYYRRLLPYQPSFMVYEEEPQEGGPIVSWVIDHILQLKKDPDNPPQFTWSVSDTVRINPIGITYEDGGFRGATIEQGEAWFSPYGDSRRPPWDDTYVFAAIPGDNFSLPPSFQGHFWVGNRPAPDSLTFSELSVREERGNVMVTVEEVTIVQLTPAPNFYSTEQRDEIEEAVVTDPQKVAGVFEPGEEVIVTVPLVGERNRNSLANGLRLRVLERGPVTISSIEGDRTVTVESQKICPLLPPSQRTRGIFVEMGAYCPRVPHLCCAVIELQGPPSYFRELPED